MLYLSFSSVIDQSLRKFRRAGHALSYLSMKTDIPFRRINSLNARRTVKLAKQLGWDPAVNWRDYPCKWHLRPAHRQDTCLCETRCPNTPLPKVNENGTINE
jgi:hypothetical protein